MKFKLDENLPKEAVEALRSAGHDAVSVLDQRLGGRPDDDVFDVIRAEGRALITLDLDFGNIHAYPPAGGPGLVVLRLASQGKPSVLNAILSVIAALAEHSPAGKLWIVEEGRLRIRG